MFLVVKEIVSGWANLEAKAEGFQSVRARYDADSQVLEIRYPPEGDLEVVENVPNLNQAKNILGRKAGEGALAVAKEIF